MNTNLKDFIGYLVWVGAWSLGYLALVGISELIAHFFYF